MGIRKIVFRAKRTDSGEWVYGSLIQFTDGDCIIVPEQENLAFREEYEVCPDTVGQFTGLKDKQTKMREVYEHDLYEVNGVLCEVVYNSDIASFVFLEVLTQELGITPIGEMFKIFTCGHKGNIHDNPVEI